MSIKYVPSSEQVECLRNALQCHEGRIALVCDEQVVDYVYIVPKTLADTFLKNFRYIFGDRGLKAVAFYSFSMLFQRMIKAYRRWKPHVAPKCLLRILLKCLEYWGLAINTTCCDSYIELRSDLEPETLQEVILKSALFTIAKEYNLEVKVHSVIKSRGRTGMEYSLFRPTRAKS